MIIRVLDPTNEMKAAGGQPAVRPTTLKGKTVGFISNGKEGTKGYFAALERQFREVFGVADVVWRDQVEFQRPCGRIDRRRDQGLAGRRRRCRGLRQLLIVQFARRYYS